MASKNNSEVLGTFAIVAMVILFNTLGSSSAAPPTKTHSHRMDVLYGRAVT